MPAGYPACSWSTGANTQNIYAKFAGNYTVTITGVSNFTAASTPVGVAVNPLPSVPVITRINDTLISTTSTSYQCYLNNGPIGAATGQNLVLAQNDTYMVEVTDNNSCSNCSAVFAVTAVNTEDVAGAANIKLYHNPSNGEFTIEFSNHLLCNIEVVNAMEQVILSYTLVTDHAQFMLQVAEGIYFVHVYENGKVTALKSV